MRIVPDRATGHLHFVLRWPSGEFSGQHITGMKNAVRLLNERLRYVPPSEREFASAHLDAELRKSGGGLKHVPLATWTGTEPLARFFQVARAAWRCLPKESDDYRKLKT